MERQGYWCFSCRAKTICPAERIACQRCGSQVLEQFNGVCHSFVPYSPVEHRRPSMQRRVPLQLSNFREIVFNPIFMIYSSERRSTGTDPDVINTLEQSALEECAICRQTSGTGLKLPCDHAFHRTCLLPWLENNNTCPCCRYQLESGPLS